MIKGGTKEVYFKISFCASLFVAKYKRKIRTVIAFAKALIYRKEKMVYRFLNTTNYASDVIYTFFEMVYTFNFTTLQRYFKHIRDKL